MCRRPSAKESKQGGPSSDEVMTGLNHNLITQRFKLNNKVALITGAPTAPGPVALSILFSLSLACPADHPADYPADLQAASWQGGSCVSFPKMAEVSIVSQQSSRQKPTACI